MPYDAGCGNAAHQKKTLIVYPTNETLSDNRRGFFYSNIALSTEQTKSTLSLGTPPKEQNLL